jgi:diaminohydroxyphosphoribosylaminopyrimidine deaminase/5-amino-6-(5-phosphoribosylamino)uracil reductase
MSSDESFMRLALREARRGIGRTSPNPAVGAVIVSPRGKVLSKGWHRAAGCPHAEIEAIRRLARPGLARGATIFVTLEPCSTHGRTPPCVDAIIEAGFARVVVGAVDPNPRHAGRGLKRLRKAGIEVISGVLKADAMALNRAFNQWIVTGMPLVIAKCAISVDGRITRRPQEGQCLTSERSRADASRFRARVDAILIGAGTLRADNPLLTVRGIRGASQPWRVVLTRSGKLPRSAHLFTDEHREKTLVFKDRPLAEVLRDLGSRGVTSVMIEGGAQVLGEAFEQRLVHCVRFYIAPLLLGGGKPALAGQGSTIPATMLENTTYRRIGNDILLTGDVRYEKTLSKGDASRKGAKTQRGKRNLEGFTG